MKHDFVVYDIASQTNQYSKTRSGLKLWKFCAKRDQVSTLLFGTDFICILLMNC